MYIPLNYSLSLGRTVSIEIDHTSTVADAKQKIHEKEGIPIHQQQLIFSGKTLENDRPLSSYNIQRDSTIHLVIRVKQTNSQSEVRSSQTTVHTPVKTGASGRGPNYSAEVNKKLQLTVSTPTSREVKIDLDANESVFALRQAIAAKLKVPPDHQTLVCAGSHLQNGRLLSDYGITFNCSVQLSYSSSSKMNLYVKTLSGTTFILNPSVYQTVGDVKDDIHNKQKFDTTNHMLIYQGVPLNEDNLLSDCQLPSQCTIHIIREDTSTHSPPRSPSYLPPSPSHSQFMHYSSDPSPSHFTPFSDPPPRSQQRSSSSATIPILFRTIKGNMVTLETLPSERVSDIKRRLQEREELPHGHEISLMLGGLELKDEDFLNDYNLQQDSTLLVTFKASYSSLIQLGALSISTSEVVTLDSIALSETIQLLEDRICQLLYINPPNRVSLIYEGIVLNPAMSVGQYNIPNGGLIHVYSDGPKQCTVTVTTVADIKCTCDMYTSETVGNLKTVIQRKLGIHYNEQVLVSKGQILANSCLLASIESGDYKMCLFTKVGVGKTLSVFLPSGKSISLCMQSHQTIADLKLAICHRCPISQLRYRGSLLEDTYCIGDYLLPDGAFLTSTSPLSSQDKYTFTVRAHGVMGVKTIIVNGQCSLRVLKVLVAQEFSFSLDLVQLFFCGDLLYNEKPIDQYGFPNPCTIWAECLSPPPQVN